MGRKLKRKIGAGGAIRPKTWPVFVQCIEGGLKGALRNELPEDQMVTDDNIDFLVDRFANRIYCELDEFFEFD